VNHGICVITNSYLRYRLRRVLCSSCTQLEAYEVGDDECEAHLFPFYSPDISMIVESDVGRMSVMRDVKMWKIAVVKGSQVRLYEKTNKQKPISWRDVMYNIRLGTPPGVMLLGVYINQSVKVLSVTT
jgi:hypothetical protein